MSMKNFIFRAHREIRDKYPGRELTLYIFKRKKLIHLVSTVSILSISNSKESFDKILIQWDDFKD